MALDVAALLADARSNFKSTEVSRPVPYDLDLGHLAVFDVNVLDTEILQQEPANSGKREAYLRDNTRDAVQALVNQLWTLPSHPSEDGTTLVADLPDPVFVIPREKPLPKPKPLTRWEKFAKEKGIQNKKKDRKVWDEQKKDWAPAWGYKGANTPDDWLIEVPQNADPMEDQFEKRNSEKKERVAKNKRQEIRNLENAGQLASQRSAPIDLKAARKKELAKSIAISKTSTASMGKFDKKLDNENVVKLRKEKRKFDAVVEADLSKERERSTKILKKVFAAEGESLNVPKAVGKHQAQEDKKRSQSYEVAVSSKKKQRGKQSGKPRK